MASLYEEWLERHLEARTGERRRRLAEGHGHAERLFAETIWLPAAGHFEDLHPEYEVANERGRPLFIDFAFTPPGLRAAIEVDGYGPHHRDLDRRQFSEQLNRQNDLVLQGWKVLRFSYDDICGRPQLCRSTIRKLLGLCYGAGDDALPLAQRELIRRAMRHGRPFTPDDAAEWTGLTTRSVRPMLHGLRALGYLEPASGRLRIRRYALTPKAERMELL